jgi:hypothetical protein
MLGRCCIVFITGSLKAEHYLKKKKKKRFIENLKAKTKVKSSNKRIIIFFLASRHTTLIFVW